jgi:murein DD-endopeptidase MepM/ murein hydrolase activator NlpD
MTGRSPPSARFKSQPYSFARPSPVPQRPSGLALPRRAAILIGGAGVALALWALGATVFIVFRDDVVTGMMHRETNLQYDYEGRISSLKAELSRLKSKQLVDQQAFLEKVDTLMRLKSSLETRQSIVQSLGDLAMSAGVKPAGPAPANEAAATAPHPLPLDGIEVLKPGKQARLQLKPATHASMAAPLFAASQPDRESGLAERLVAVAGSLDSIETGQMASLQALAAHAKTRTSKIRDTLQGLGLRTPLPSAAQSEGGPFIPLELAPNASAFEAVAHDVQDALSDADALNRSLTSIPVRRPFANAEITSGFGPRVDPFLGRSALHAGIDFREATGAPVRATAAGKITEASWVGGYGNMVEIDHGGGLTTRFGHLSEILVAPGTIVAVGDIVGRVGSTGRSTGPHLHYETRIDGTPVDPMRFLRAEQKLAEVAGG